jgi:hypothetical protein
MDRWKLATPAEVGGASTLKTLGGQTAASATPVRKRFSRRLSNPTPEQLRRELQAPQDADQRARPWWLNDGGDE